MFVIWNSLLTLLFFSLDVPSCSFFRSTKSFQHLGAIRRIKDPTLLTASMIKELTTPFRRRASVFNGLVFRLSGKKIISPTIVALIALANARRVVWIESRKACARLLRWVLLLPHLLPCASQVWAFHRHSSANNLGSLKRWVKETSDPWIPCVHHQHPNWCAWWIQHPKTKKRLQYSTTSRYILLLFMPAFCLPTDGCKNSTLRHAATSLNARHNNSKHCRFANTCETSAAAGAGITKINVALSLFYFFSM